MFTLVVFLLLWKQADEDNGDQYSWLPLVAVFMGMFVKSGERLIYGIAQRFLKAVEAMFPFPARQEPERESESSEESAAQASEKNSGKSAAKSKDSSGKGAKKKDGTGRS